MIVFLRCGLVQPNPVPSEGAARDHGHRRPITEARGPMTGWRPGMLLMPMTTTMAETVLEEAAEKAARKELER